jgi:GT2 family glycosyltransferase
LLRNGADYKHFAGAMPRGLLDQLSAPIIGYCGTLSDWLDLELIEEAARAYSDWQFVFVGRLDFATAGYARHFEAICTLPNVHYLGQVSYADLPDYIAGFDVCTVPFRDLPITQAMNVVKVYDYLAVGKPVVATDLAEMRPFAALGLADLFQTRESYLDLLKKAVERRSSPEQIAQRRQVAAQNTWEARCDELCSSLADLHSSVIIIVVTFNNPVCTRLCLESVLAYTRWPRFRIVIVDNGSDDELITYLSDMAGKHSEIDLILNGKNFGFAGANNVALRRYADQADYFALLNDDTVVTTGWLPRLMRHLRQKGVGLVGPVTSFAGNEARIEIGYQNLSEMQHWALAYMRDHDGQTCDLPMLSGFCWLLSRATLEQVGYLDERFGVGTFEDDDYARRVREVGLRVVCCEDVFIHHFGRTSFNRLSEAEYQHIFETNRALYEEKWRERWVPYRPRGG